MASNESVASDGSDRASGSSEKAGSDGSFSLVPKTRYCAVKGCKARLALQVYDPHTLCVKCRGSQCDLGIRCEVCSSWDEHTMSEYLAHQQKLEAGRMWKAQAKAKARKRGCSGCRFLPGIGTPGYVCRERESAPDLH